jgi:hypothetical protein
MNRSNEIREFRRHLSVLQQQKPSRRQIPQILRLLQGILMILAERDSDETDGLLRIVEQVSKKYKGAATT